MKHTFLPSTFQRRQESLVSHPRRKWELAASRSHSLAPVIRIGDYALSTRLIALYYWTSHTSDQLGCDHDLCIRIYPLSATLSDAACNSTCVESLATPTCFRSEYHLTASVTESTELLPTTMTHLPLYDTDHILSVYQWQQTTAVNVAESSPDSK